MSTWLWLAGVGLAGFGAWLAGWPAWRSYRMREQRDLNAERYLAWRGRAPRGPRPSVSEGLTGEERRRLYAAAAMAAVGIVCLIGFLASSSTGSRTPAT
jgi:hypothetical protein